MASERTPLILGTHSPYKVLEFVLRKHSDPSTIVICGRRREFLQALLQDCHGQDNHHEDGLATPRSNLLLTNTIGLIAQSQSIRMVFVEDLPQLRAYLSTFVPQGLDKESKTAYEKPGNTTPMLFLINPISLHELTSEFSAQGLTRTLALAVEAAHRYELQLLMAQTTSESCHNEENEMGQMTSPWTMEIPLLNGSIRFGGGESLPIGKTVRISQVVRRWFRFLPPDI
jgi:hypothetical protein